MRSVPPVGIAWQALSARFSSAWPQHARVGVDLGQVGRALVLDRDVRRASASGVDGRHDVADERGSWTGCSFSSSGRAKFRKPLTTWSSRRISLEMMWTCFERSTRGPTPPGSRPAR